MTNQNNLKISGMLNQHEFKERYIFTQQRIINGFSRQDLAFLLGRMTNDVSDYEQLGTHVKMNYQDHEVMAAVFKTLAPAAPMFYPKANEIDISNEKRMIRGSVTETDTQRLFDFIHPWKIKGENKPINIAESLVCDRSQDLKISEFVQQHLFQFKKAGCFDRGCTALFLYQQLTPVVDKVWKPLFLKVLRALVYAQIHAQEIKSHEIDGRVFYKTTSLKKI